MVTFYESYRDFLVRTVEKSWREELDALTTVFDMSASARSFLSQADPDDRSMCMSLDDWRALMREYDASRPRQVVVQQFKELSKGRGVIKADAFAYVLDVLLVSFKREEVVRRSYLSHLLLNSKLDVAIMLISAFFLMTTTDDTWGSEIGQAVPTLRLLSSFTSLKRILLDVVRIVTPLSSFLGLLILLIIFWGLVGHALFADNAYFATFGDTMLSLFLLFQSEAIVNIVDSVLASGHFYNIWFFVVFQFVTVWLISNIFVGIVFHYFARRRELDNDRNDGDEGGEAGDWREGDEAAAAAAAEDRASVASELGGAEGPELGASEVLSPTELVLAEKLAAGLISREEFTQLLAMDRMANNLTVDLKESERHNVIRSKLAAGIISEEEYAALVAADKGAADIMVPADVGMASSDGPAGAATNGRHTRLRKKQTTRATARNMERQLIKMERQLPSTREVEQQLLHSKRGVGVHLGNIRSGQARRISVMAGAKVSESAAREGEAEPAASTNPMISPSSSARREMEMASLSPRSRPSNEL
eukprot:g2028.t1